MTAQKKHPHICGCFSYSMEEILLLLSALTQRFNRKTLTPLTLLV